MPGHVDEDYFTWLTAKIRKHPAPLYDGLLEILYTTQFVWVVPMDENRAMDGVELRNRYLLETGLDAPDDPCSILEMMVAFSYHCEFETDIHNADWFWTFVQNLGLDEYRQVGRRDLPYISDTLDDFVWRRYGDDGRGGMFPIQWPKVDERGVDIWHQFNHYVIERDI